VKTQELVERRLDLFGTMRSKSITKERHQESTTTLTISWEFCRYIHRFECRRVVRGYDPMIGCSYTRKYPKLDAIMRAISWIFFISLPLKLNSLEGWTVEARLFLHKGQFPLAHQFVTEPGRVHRGLGGSCGISGHQSGGGPTAGVFGTVFAASPGPCLQQGRNEVPDSSHGPPR